MRKFILSAVVAVAAVLSFAAPSQAAGPYGGGYGHGWGGHHRHVSHYYGHHHRHCHWKKIKRYDKWGHVVIKRVRVCR